MSFTPVLRLSPFVLLLAIASSSGCGGSVSGGGGNAGDGGGTTTTTGTGATSTTTTTGTGAFDLCTGPGQCTLVSAACCDPCGMQSLASVNPINADQTEEYYQALCPQPVACPACVSAPNPNLFAFCEAGHCAEADVTTHAASACSGDDDCRLRNGAACCESCAGGAEQLVAVAIGNDLMGLLCGPNDGCPKCLPQYPPDAAAICSNGHCAVVFMGSGTGG